jgi:hypothetical protein
VAAPLPWGGEFSSRCATIGAAHTPEGGIDIRSSSAGVIQIILIVIVWTAIAAFAV